MQGDVEPKQRFKTLLACAKRSNVRQFVFRTRLFSLKEIIHYYYLLQVNTLGKNKYVVWVLTWYIGSGTIGTWNGVDKPPATPVTSVRDTYRYFKATNPRKLSSLCNYAILGGGIYGLALIRYTVAS